MSLKMALLAPSAMTMAVGAPPPSGTSSMTWDASSFMSPVRMGAWSQTFRKWEGGQVQQLGSHLAVEQLVNGLRCETLFRVVKHHLVRGAAQHQVKVMPGRLAQACRLSHCARVIHAAVSVPTKVMGWPASLSADQLTARHWCCKPWLLHRAPVVFIRPLQAVANRHSRAVVGQGDAHMDARAFGRRACEAVLHWRFGWWHRQSSRWCCPRRGW